MMTHPGTPCVFWDHWQDGGALGKNVQQLVKVRQQHGLHCRSKVHSAASLMISISEIAPLRGFAGLHCYAWGC